MLTLSFVCEKTIGPAWTSRVEGVDEVRNIEAQIDELAARLWGLSKAELKEIQQPLAELRS